MCLIKIIIFQLIIPKSGNLFESGTFVVKEIHSTKNCNYSIWLWLPFECALCNNLICLIFLGYLKLAVASVDYLKGFLKDSTLYDWCVNKRPLRAHITSGRHFFLWHEYMNIEFNKFQLVAWKNNFNLVQRVFIPLIIIFVSVSSIYLSIFYLYDNFIYSTDHRRPLLTMCVSKFIHSFRSIAHRRSSFPMFLQHSRIQLILIKLYWL